MKGYRDRRQLTPRKKYVKNKFVVTYAGFKTPTEATVGAAVTSTEIEQKGDADEQRTDYRTGLGTGFKA